jgi:hypothetical protein
MKSRRQTLIQLAGAAGLAAVGSAQVNSHQHADATTSQPGDKPKIDPKKPRQAQFFTNQEFETVEVVAELIIPRTDTPGAKDAGVAYIIDERVPRVDRIRREWREGLAQLDKPRRFVALPPAEQVELLTRMSTENNTPARRFFELIKGATVDAYYDTKEGLAEELGWQGNQALTEFVGCTHPEHQA